MLDVLPSTTHAMLEGIALVARLAAIRDLRFEQPDSEELAPGIADWVQRREQWWQRLVALATGGQRVPLVELAERLGLEDKEVDALLVLVAPRADPELLDPLIGRAGSTLFRGISSELLLGLLFPTPADRFVGRRVIAANGVLVRNGLVELRPVGSDLSPSVVEVRPSEGLVDFVLDRPLVSGPMSQYCELAAPVHGWDRVVLDSEAKEQVWAAVSGTPGARARMDRWGYADVMPRSRGLVLLFAGPPGTGKSMFANAVAERLNCGVLNLFTSRLIAHRESIRPIVAEAFRIAALAGAIVILDDGEALLDQRDQRFLALLECLDRHEGILILTTNSAPAIDFAMERRIQLRLDFERPEPQLREQIWEAHLPAEAPLGDDIDIPALAAAYEFTGGQIRNSVLLAMAHLDSSGAEELDMALLRRAADTQLGARLDELAVKARTDVGLDRLVLPEEQLGQIDEILRACRHREFVLTRWGFGRRLTTGRGLCILFDGPPGTGKTFTAELLANELRLPMYRVHIPNVVSKWVGETERNIARIFERARSARAALLFDEADSLFGRRTGSVQSANDRYANMEINLLLQEIERYDGVTFLTTNLYGNLDEALQRRIQFRVTFPFPEAAERAQIWEVLTPPEAPLDPDVDFEDLGRRYELAGGHIKNALLRAAYRARDDDSPIARRHLMDAAIAECKAQGKIVRASESSGRRRRPGPGSTPQTS